MRHGRMGACDIVLCLRALIVLSSISLLLGCDDTLPRAEDPLDVVSDIDASSSDTDVCDGCSTPFVCVDAECVCTGLTGPEQCREPAADCCTGQGCVDLATDPANCGRCGTICGPGEVCSGGVCNCGLLGASCVAGTVCCGVPGMQSCVAPDSPLCACGVESRLCTAGQVCCPGPDGTGCRNVATDEQHCGGCNIACGAGTQCVDGRCQTCSCAVGQGLCGGRCVDLQTEREHCGGCGMPCPSGQVCTNGRCATS